MGISRRDFVSMMTAVLGSGIFLAGCGGGGGGGTPPAGTGGGGAAGAPPNGFRFLEVLHSDNLELPTLNRSQEIGAKAALRASAEASPYLRAFTGGLELTNGGHVFFHAVDMNGHVALYQGDLQEVGGVLRLVGIRRVIGEGDLLPDGTRVTGIGVGQANAQGAYATILQLEEAPRAIYLGSAEEGFQPFARLGDPMPGGGGILGGDFRYVGMDDQGNLAFLSSHVPEGTCLPVEGLAHVVGGDPSHPQSGILLSSQNALPDGLGMTAGLGLFAMSPGGHFVLQTTIDQGDGIGGGDLIGIRPPGGPKDPGPEPSPEPTRVPTRGVAGLPETVVLQGTVRKPGMARIVAASRSAAVNPLLRSVHQLAEGSAIYGPRITSGGIPVTVLHQDESHMALYYGETLVAETGGASPQGNTIASFAPPVCGGDDRIYFVLICEETAELVMYDGVESRTILARGDRVGPRTISGLNFGLTPKQADLQDRIVLLAEFEDGTSGIVLGTPV